MNSVAVPLRGPSPSEVPLPDAPLVRVIAQARFPLITSIEKREFIASFQEVIRSEYPSLRPAQNRALVLGPEGLVEKSESRTWRFNDASEEWRVTLAPDFLAFETTKYTSRDDFLARFGFVLRALESEIDPQVIDRLGIRYVDRVVGDPLSELAKLVKPEVAGVLASGLFEFTHQAVCEHLFKLPDEGGRLMARWGLLPPNSSVNPAVVEPIDEMSWLLDLDAFLSESRPFDSEALVQETRALAERIYTFFRWTVTDEFLRRYGGSV